MAEEARRVAEARVAELELALCDAEGEALERELRAKAMAESAAAKSLIESAESVERWQDRCKVSEGYVKQLREELLRTEKREEDAIVRLEKSDKEAARLAAALSDLERDIQGEARRRAVAIFQAEQIKGVKSRERSPGMGRLGAIASRDVGCQTEASVESQVSEASRRLVASAEAMGRCPHPSRPCPATPHRMRITWFLLSQFSHPSLLFQTLGDRRCLDGEGWDRVFAARSNLSARACPRNAPGSD